MSKLPVLRSRINTAKAILERWQSYDLARAAEAAEALAARPSARRVEFVDDVKPHHGNELASYIVEVVAEHRRAAKQSIGDPAKHADAAAAWIMTAQQARADAGYETVARLVEIAAELSDEAIESAKRR